MNKVVELLPTLFNDNEVDTINNEEFTDFIKQSLISHNELLGFLA